MPLLLKSLLTPSFSGRGTATMKTDNLMPTSLMSPYWEGWTWVTEM